MTTRTIPGQLFLLLTNDAGRQDSISYRQQALAAAAVGVVQRKDGWFTTSWPTHDDTYENSLRARIAGAVRDPRTASLQDGVLLELLRTLGVAHRILGGDLPELSRKELDQRIEGLDVDHPAALAVKKMMNDMTAVMIATTTATTIMT